MVLPDGNQRRIQRRIQSRPGGPGPIGNKLETRARFVRWRRQRTMKLSDSTTSAVGAGPTGCILQWPAPGYPGFGGARPAASVRRQGGITVIGNAGLARFLKLTARQKAVWITTSQRFEERDCRVGSSHGHGRRCIGAIEASHSGCQKNLAFSLHLNVAHGAGGIDEKTTISADSRWALEDEERGQRMMI